MDHRRISRAEAAAVTIDARGLIAFAALRQAGSRTARIAATLGGTPERCGTQALVAVFTGADPGAARALGHSFHPGRAAG